jgi:hypothetical protein
MPILDDATDPPTDPRQPPPPTLEDVARRLADDLVALRARGVEADRLLAQAEERRLARLAEAPGGVE